MILMQREKVVPEVHSKMMLRWCQMEAKFLEAVMIVIPGSLNVLIFESSVHFNMSLSFCSFSYNGVCFDRLKLSVMP